MKQIFTIKNRELKNLLFWAMAGYTDCNGGSGERSISKIISKYVQETGMKPNQFPPLGIKSHAELTGETKKRLVKELQRLFPKTRF